MDFNLDLKCGGKVTRVEIIKNKKLVKSIDMDSHNHIVSGGRDYICTWRGDNSMPSMGCYSTTGSYYAGSLEVATTLNMLYGFPNVNNYYDQFYYYNGDTWGSNDFPMNNRHGQIGPLTFGKIGSSDTPTLDTDTNLHSPISDLVIDSYQNGLAAYHASCIKSDNSFTLRCSYCFDISSDATIREFGTFGKYVDPSVDITTSNYNQISIYQNSRMFTRTVLEHPVEVHQGEQAIVIYEFTIQFPSSQEVATTLAGHNCVRSFHLPPKDPNSVVDRWYGLNANGSNLPIGFISTRNHTMTDVFNKSTNTVYGSISNTSVFPLASLRFCSMSPKSNNDDESGSDCGKGVNASSALGMSPIAYIDNCGGDYSNWYRQSLKPTDTNGNLRNILNDCTEYEHTMETYIPGTSYRVHNFKLKSLKTARPTVYGIGLMGYIYRFGQYDGDNNFVAEPISIADGLTISYSIKLSISNPE